MRRPGIRSAAAMLAILLPAAAKLAGDSQTRVGPPLEVRTPDGKVLQVRSLKGRVVVLDFMTTVCPSCRMASAGLQKLYQELGPKGFCPVGIALNVDAPPALESYRREHRLTFTLGTAGRASVLDYLQHPPEKPFYVPTLVLLDRQGRIRAIEVGWKGEEALRTAVLKLLTK